MSVENDNKIICPNCKSELPEGSRFCNNCGYKIETELIEEVVDKAPQNRESVESPKVSEPTVVHLPKKTTPPQPKKSKLLLVLGIAVATIIISLVIALYLGGGLHSHKFGSWEVTKEPTCVSTGTEVRTCECGEIEVHAIESKGHTEVVDSAVNPSCSTAGLTAGKHCKSCGMVIVPQTSIDKVPHTYDDKFDESCNKCGFIREAECAHNETQTIYGYAATCTSTGLTDGTKCKKCGEILKQQTTIGKLGHAEVIDSAISATCTTDGKTEGKHCSRCNQTLVAQTTITKYGHFEISDPAVAATCTTDGKTEGKHCSRCNLTLVAQTTIPASGHNYNDGEIISEATCTTQGIKRYTCTVSSCTHSYTDTYSLPTYTATEIYNQALSYVGEITVYDKSGYVIGTGTGFVMSSDGKIITNYHVIDEAYYADIVINNTKYAIYSVLAYDANIDLAVLKINATGLTMANICKSTVQTGEAVYAMGSSKGLTNTFSQGIITQAQRVIDGVVHIQHDAAISGGNSGGPLLNVYGEVIGINKMSRVDSQNINMAVFTTELENLVYLGTPMTLQELYEQNHNAYDILVDFIIENGEYDSDRGAIELSLVNEYNSTHTEYHIMEFSYHPDSDYVDLTFYVAFVDSDLTFFTGISIEKNVDSYYYAFYVYDDNTKTNQISGFIEYDTFTRNTLVGYNSYIGNSSQESTTRENASLSVVYLIEYLEWLAINYLNLTIVDFGFISF